MLETPWDAFNVSVGLASLTANLATGNLPGAAVDAAGLAVDLTATAIPGVPGGTSAAINAYRGSQLARNLAAAGRPVEKGVEACHHLVAKNAARAQEARDRLNALGIGLDDAANGVGLPIDFHQGLHTNDYYRFVNEASRDWNTPEQAVNGLQDLANTLRQQAQ